MAKRPLPSFLIAFCAINIFSARLAITEEFELQIDLGKTAEARSATLVYLENNLQPHATVRGA